MKTLAEEYEGARVGPSDINEHVPILCELAKNCREYGVTELGVRYGESTRAFIHAGVKLRSYDVAMFETVEELFAQARRGGQDAKYIYGDSLKIEIEPTDMLFIDTNHTYEQLTEELERHAPMTRKYIAMHDTYNMGLGAYNTEPRGLLTAIIDFMIRHPRTWAFHSHYTNNNGLTILQRELWSN